MAKYDLYMRAYTRELDEFTEAVEAGETPETKPVIIRLVHYGVKAIINKKELDYIDRIEREAHFNSILAIRTMMATLTPNEFMRVFPIEKDYKGHRWGFKDYFYTKAYIQGLDSNKPIGENIDEFLWEYHNWDIAEFVVRSMSCISDLRRLDGQSTFMDDFVETMDIDTLSLYTDDQGKQFIVDKYGRTSRVAKPRPRHLKLIK